MAGKKTALVTGANGYIGLAVAQAFQRAGYSTLGLIRSSKSVGLLEKASIIPIIGSAKDPQAILAAIKTHTTVLNTIASVTEDNKDYASHFNDTVRLLRLLADMSNDHGTRPLVLFTSGSKDYGRGELDGSPNLSPHTEDSPLHPPPRLTPRAIHAPEILKEESFDAVVLRPTHVHGYSSSYLGQFFEWAADAKRNGTALRLQADPSAILHSLHVDDCGDAYVCISNHPNRDEVTGQIFNVSSGNRYETVRDIGEALVKLYEIPQGVEFQKPESQSLDDLNPLINFSQWAGSEKLRNLTHWADSRPMFSDGISQYKQEYEASVQSGDGDAAGTKARLATLH